MGYVVNAKIVEDEFYFHTDYRRDLNYNYCKKVDYVMWGETDSFFPKEAFQSLESLSKYTDSQNIHRYITCFADRKMWDDSWNPTVHKDYEHLEYIDDENHHLHKTQAKSVLSIEEMNEINSKVDDFDFDYINYPKIDGSCLVISSDLIKSGVNIPKSSFFIHEDTAFMLQLQQMFQGNIPQYVIKNVLLVHNRKHTKKRSYVEGELKSDDVSGGRLRHEWYKKASDMSHHNTYNMFNQSKIYTWDDVFND